MRSLVSVSIERPSRGASALSAWSCLIGLAVLCVTILDMLVAQAAEKKTLVGVWEVKISAGACNHRLY
jgi:hypothetical protein